MLNIYCIDRRPTVLALIAIAATCVVGCARHPEVLQPVTGAGDQQVRFTGVVASQGLIHGGRRFSAGTQGVWFRLHGDPSLRFNYFVGSLESAGTAGILEAQADGGWRFADLRGKRASGTAELRSATSLEVTALQLGAPD